jgi:quaternary ammonium compound-resistance protein SugE
MAWFQLILAGLLEIVWAIGLKYTDGFTKLWPSVVTLIAMFLSFGLLSHAIKHIPIGTAYAVWTGIGAVGVAIVGMILLGEPRSIARIACILVIVLGIMGLKMLSDHQPA